MAENVFILGAGASKDTGAPLMADFLDKAEMIYLYEIEKYLRFKHSDEKEKIKNDFKNVFKAISDLQLIYSKSFLDLYNIESLFGAIEMGVLINRLLDYSSDKIKSLRNSIINLIVKTLEISIQFPTNKEYTRNQPQQKFYRPDQLLNPSETYSKLVDLICQIRESSILTFNYDISVDFALFKQRNFINYCLEQDDSEGYPLLKLHGSVNWGLCHQCKKIIPMSFEDCFEQYKFNFNPSESYNVLPISEGLQVFTHSTCSTRVDTTPVLVPPTWNKTEYQTNLANVWNKAAKELFEAKNIFIMGYSFPETDSFFRYLYALGTAGPNMIKRIWIYNPDETVKTRFSTIIGSGVQNRFNFFPMKFSEAIEHIRENI